MGWMKLSFVLKSAILFISWRNFREINLISKEDEIAFCLKVFRDFPFNWLSLIDKNLFNL